LSGVVADPTPSNSQDFNNQKDHNSSFRPSTFDTVRTPVVWSVLA
jgi:hypothetical protein